MGSLNTACFATRQIVCPGDKVLLWLIKSEIGYAPVKGTIKGDDFESHVHKSFGVYPTTRWSVRGRPLRAVYADYGSFDLDLNDTSTVDTLMTMLINVLSSEIKVKAGENPYHENAYDFEEVALRHGLCTKTVQKLGNTGYTLTSFDRVSPQSVEDKARLKEGLREFWELLQNAARQNRLLASSIYNTALPMSFCCASIKALEAVKNPSFEKMVGKLHFESRENDALSNAKQKEVFYTELFSNIQVLLDSFKISPQDGAKNLGELEKAIRGFLEKMAETNPSLRNSLRYSLDPQISSHLVNYLDTLRIEDPRIFKKMGSQIIVDVLNFCGRLYSLFGSHDYGVSQQEDLERFSELVFKAEALRCAESKETVKQVLAELIEESQFVSMVFACSINFEPMSYTSQDYATETGKLYAKLVQLASKK